MLNLRCKRTIDKLRCNTPNARRDGLTAALVQPSKNLPLQRVECDEDRCPYQMGQARSSHANCSLLGKAQDFLNAKLAGGYAVKIEEVQDELAGGDSGHIVTQKFDELI